MFPAEGVPDGVLFAPHHFIYGMHLFLLTGLVVWDDYRKREPIVSVAAAGVALFSWFHVWKYYPPAGAVGVLAGTLVALGNVVLSDDWAEYPRKWRALAAFWLLFALDDALSHAFGIWTPLDWLWKAGLYKALTGF